MERWGLHLPQLDARSHFNMTLNTSAVREVPWTAENKTRAVIASLQLAQVQTIRTMHLTLGAFSLALTLLTVHRIISDARRAAAVQVPLRKQRFSALRNVHSAETFPLVLACGAVIQQIIFVAVQSTSLRSVLSRNCRGLAMVTFPAIFLMGYITLVFGIEMAIRSMKYNRFEQRGKWNVTICIGVISFLTMLTWMPTVAWPMYNRCFGSLIWFPVRYELIALIILGILVAGFLILAALISIQLMRTANVDPNERIAASRMCYFLLMAALIYTMVIPVEVQAHRRDFMNTLATSRIAEVALFCSGIFIAFFHLFLRVNATRFVISPMSEMNSTSKPKRPRIRFFGPSDLEMNISGPMALQGGRRPDSRQGLIDVGPEKNRFDFESQYYERPNRPLTPASVHSQGAIDPTRWPLPPDPENTGYLAEEKEMGGLHRRTKSNYSLFPTRAEDIPRLPATIYSPKANEERSRLSNLAMRRQVRRSSLGDTKSITDIGEAFSFLSKPAPFFGKKHNRNSSASSSATVQIGLRFSVAPATLAAAKCTRIERQVDNENTGPKPSGLRHEQTNSSDESLDLPIQSPSAASTFSDILNDDLATSPLNFPKPPLPTLSPAKYSPGKTPAFPTLSSATYLQSQREKILPPTPRSSMPRSAAPTSQAPLPPHPGMSGLRMNPVSPGSPSTPSSSSSGRTSPAHSNMSRSPTTNSPTSRIPLGAGTMARSPPRNGWI